MRQRIPTTRIVIAFALWIAALLYGVNWLLAYSFDGAKVELPSQAPAEAQRGLGKEPTLFVFLHPKCPCSLATAENLKQLVSRMKRSEIEPRIRVFYFCPADGDTTWVTETRLYAQLSGFPGIQQELDRDGVLAARLGASKSGHVVVIQPDGQIAFSGGITDQRGHEGDSLGMQAIQAILLRRSPPVRTVPVFGCRFFAGVKG
ncbi:MAG: hypothetical protein D6753_09530 [Planctomycetota bacterium]|nr:MAG: hypothetical protein D6753_09530 [Planctomycetota bacterium]